MQNVQYDFYLIRSNLTHPDVPRLFLVKKNNNRIHWSFELDEIHDTILVSEFDQEEAEYWGTIQKIEPEAVVVRTIYHESEMVTFSSNMKWSIETLMMDKHVVLRSLSSICVGRPIGREKYRNHPEVAKAELEHFKDKGETLQKHTVSKKSHFSEEDSFSETSKKRHKKR